MDHERHHVLANARRCRRLNQNDKNVTRVYDAASLAFEHAKVDGLAREGCVGSISKHQNTVGRSTIRLKIPKIRKDRRNAAGSRIAIRQFFLTGSAQTV